MSKLNPEDPEFVKKMHQYNKKFREYVSEYSRNGVLTKEEVLKLHVAREVALYYFYGDQTEEPEPTVVETTVKCGC